MNFINTAIVVSVVSAIGSSILIWLSRDPKKQKLLPIIAIVLLMLPLSLLLVERHSSMVDVENQKRSIAPKIEAILYAHDLLIDSMKVDAQIHAKTTIDDKDLQTILAHVGPHDKSAYVDPHSNQPLTWIQGIHANNQLALQYIGLVKEYMPYLDSELLAIFGELEDSMFIKLVYAAFNKRTGKDDSLFLLTLFQHFDASMEKLQTYYDENLKEYSSGKMPLYIQPVIQRDNS